LLAAPVLHAEPMNWASLLANPTPPQLNDQTIWMIVAAVGVGVLYFLMRPRKGNKRDPLGGAPSFPLARQRGVEEQMSNLLVELSEMARQISAQLDTRAAKLELLIKEADEKIAALRGTIGVNGSAASPAAPQAAAEDSSTTTIAPTAHVDSAEQAALSDIKDSPPAAPAPPAADPRHTQVYAMADEGRSANEIARALHRPAGEVELILALRVR
jgi:hypothetical protein